VSHCVALNRPSCALITFAHCRPDPPTINSQLISDYSPAFKAPAV
jgi:hypothetical protein